MYQPGNINHKRPLICSARCRSEMCLRFNLPEITDTLAVEVTGNLRNLTIVDLSWNFSITDETVSALLMSCGMLSEIALSGLKRITSQPLMPIISGLAEWRKRREIIRSRLRKRHIVCSVRDMGALEVGSLSFLFLLTLLQYDNSIQEIRLVHLLLICLEKVENMGALEIGSLSFLFLLTLFQYDHSIQEISRLVHLFC